MSWSPQIGPYKYIGSYKVDGSLNPGSGYSWNECWVNAAGVSQFAQTYIYTALTGQAWSGHLPLMNMLGPVVERETGLPYANFGTVHFSGNSRNLDIALVVQSGRSRLDILRSYDEALSTRESVGSTNQYQRFGVAVCTTDDNVYYIFLKGHYYGEPSGDGFVNTVMVIDRNKVASTLGVNPEDINPIITDPNQQGGTSKTKNKGGDGTFDLKDDTINEPEYEENYTPGHSGMISLIKMTVAEMNLWTTLIFSDDYIDVINKFIFGNPRELMCGLGILPYTPGGSTSCKAKLGSVILDQLLVMAESYTTIDCGAVYIDEYWGNCLDYSPYTKIQIYLPYIGYKELDVDEIMGKRIQVKYHCNNASGDCIAFILVDNSVKYQFAGNCLQQLPINSQNFDNMVSSSINLAISAATTLASAGAGFPAAEVGNPNVRVANADDVVEPTPAPTGLIDAAVQMVMNSKPTISRSGAVSGGSSQLTTQKPHLIRIIPNQSLPDDYNKFHGYPSNETWQLGDLSGYTVVDDIQLNGLPCTEGEHAEIMDWLKKGVII